MVTVPPINAASVCCGVGLVIPAAARSRFARVKARSLCPLGRLARVVPVVELTASVLPVALPFTELVVVVAVLMLLLFPVTRLLLSPTMLLLPVIVVPPGRKMSTSLIAVALALLVLVLLDDALGALEVVAV